MSLIEYGWTTFFEDSFRPFCEQGLTPGRVVLLGGEVRLVAAAGEAPAVVAGRLRHRAGSPADLPAVGDWVAFRPPEPGSAASIEAVLPRRTKISRKVAGARTAEQVVAANVDTIFVVMGLDGDYNPRRIERYLTLVWDSGARPVVLLNKEDLLSPVEAQERQAEIEEVALGVPVHRLSCLVGRGLDGLAPYLGRRDGRVETVVLLGSSGAGKSTLINRLAGRRVMATEAVRESDQRGRHTTTHRELVRLPGGGLLIDNPGLREIQLWSSGEGLAGAFEDIEELAAGCRFRDCRHQGEPGCAVEEAVRDGRLAAERLESLHRLARELRYLEQRQDESARRLEQRKWKTIHKEMRRFHKPGRPR